MMDFARSTAVRLAVVGIMLAGAGFEANTIAAGSMDNASAMDSTRSTGMHPIAPTALTGTVTGPALVKQLRDGGLILWMRHGTRDNRPGDVTDAQAKAHDCPQQSELTAEGEAQARAVGEGIRALKLPIAVAYAARLCRTETTAHLLNVAPVSPDDRLDEPSTWTNRGGDAADQKAVLELLNTPIQPGKDVVVVASKLTIPNPHPAVLAALGPAEVAIFRPNPHGDPQLIAQIGYKAWATLAREANNE